MKIFIGLLLLMLVMAAPEGDLVTNLPDYPYKASKIYSGYLSVTGTIRKLHYVFVESQGDEPKDAPVTLWLNGGPGCSSLIGFGDENGPAVMEDDTALNLIINPYSWNKLSNILYIEGPAGVGFSISEPDFKPDDHNTATDELAALIEFFKLFEEYKLNDFYISGESYAGVYVPNLATQILEFNEKSSDFKFNLKGLFIGNGVTHPILDSDSVIDYLYSHSVINLQTKQDYYKFCTGTPDENCFAVFDKIELYMNHINAYDIYKKCDRIGGFSAYNYRRTAWLKWKLLNTKGKNQNLKGEEDCSMGKGIINYFNREDVQNELHVSINNKWIDCSDDVGEIYTPDDRASFYLYPNLIQNKLRIWHYNGDTDSVVPFNGTLAWMKLLNLDVIKPWHQWRLNEDYIAGYKIDYDGLSFMTVRGTGHMVPQWKREEAFHLFKSFLMGSDI